MGNTLQNTMPEGVTMEARYQRAMQLVQGMYNNKVVHNDIVYPHWIAQSGCFWYERRLKNGKQYRLVDAKAKTNTVAFDHQALAQALAVDKEVNADDLPLHAVDISLSPLQISFDAFDRRWLFRPTWLF